jgi:hypothetical protein
MPLPLAWALAAPEHEDALGVELAVLAVAAALVAVTIAAAGR